MIKIRLEGGPFAGREGELWHDWPCSWFRVVANPADDEDFLLTPGEAGRGELYVLAHETGVCVYRHMKLRSKLLDLASGVYWGA